MSRYSKTAGITPYSPTVLSPSRRITVDQAAFGCLCALVFAIPWAEQVPLLAGFAIGRWLGLLAIAAALLRLLVTRRARRVSRLHYCMGAFVAWNALSILWSVAPDRTTVRIGTYVQLLVMVWLIWELAPTAQRWTVLLYSYCFGTYVSALSTIYNAISGISAAQSSLKPQSWRTEGFGEGRYAAAGFDENELGLLLALSIPMTLYLLGRRRSGILAYACWLQLIVCTLAVLLTGSRGALISLMVAFTMFAWTFSGLSKWQKVVSLIVIAALVAGCAYVVPGTIWDRLSTIRTELAQGTLSHRINIWQAGWNVFRENPFLGVGSGAFGPSAMASLNTDYPAHNSYLSVLVELGLTGAWIFALLLASMLYMTTRMKRPERRFWTILLLAWGLGVCALTWEYSKPTWLLFGLFAVHARIAQGRGSAHRTSGRQKLARVSGRQACALAQRTAS